MDYKKVENFAFWTVMVGMGVVLASYFLFDIAKGRKSK